jgi:hypothetical protein
MTADLETTRRDGSACLSQDPLRTAYRTVNDAFWVVADESPA